MRMRDEPQRSCSSARRSPSYPECGAHARAGAAGGIEAGSVTFPVAQRVIEHSVLVDENSIVAALRGLYRHDRQLAEGSAGVAVAGFLQEASQYAQKRFAVAGKFAVRVLNRAEIQAAIAPAAAIAAVAAGFKAYSAGEVTVPAVGYLEFKHPPGDVHIKYGYRHGDSVLWSRLPPDFMRIRFMV